MMNEQQQALFNLCLRLGDSSLVLGHRLSEWCGHGPFLEEDIALTNISLDFVGLTRNLYSYAATLEGKGRTEDDLAYTRNEREFRNALLTEQPNGDYAQTICRQFFYDVFCELFYRQLLSSKDEQLKAIAGKAIKEIQYHLRHSREWFLRLGEGTEESHTRMQNALNELWMFTGDLFVTDDVTDKLIAESICPDLKTLQPEWQKVISQTILETGLQVPEDTFQQSGSLQGKHTEHLGYLLAEMQYLQRSYPGNTW